MKILDCALKLGEVIFYVRKSVKIEKPNNVDNGDTSCKEVTAPSFCSFIAKLVGTWTCYDFQLLKVLFFGCLPSSICSLVTCIQQIYQIWLYRKYTITTYVDPFVIVFWPIYCFLGHTTFTYLSISSIHIHFALVGFFKIEVTLK